MWKTIKVRCKLGSVTSWYTRNNSVARRNLCSCHKEQDLPIILSVCKHSKVTLCPYELTSVLMPWEKKTNWLGISMFDMPSLDYEYEFILNDL